VEQNDVEAVRWYRAAAEQRHAGAQFNLGAMHYNGKGMVVDYAAAAKWWKLAASQGHEEAITNLPLALILLFPSGTAVELVGLKAAILNGKRGVVVAAAGGAGAGAGAAAAEVGKVTVRMDADGRVQAAAFENLQRV
jgi:TPR repeat protein